MMWYWNNIYVHTHFQYAFKDFQFWNSWWLYLHISLPLDVVCCIIAGRIGKEKRKARQVCERDWDRDGNGDGLSQSVRLNYLIMSHYWALINPHPSPDITARTRRGREAFIPSSCFLAPNYSFISLSGFSHLIPSINLFLHSFISLVSMSF